MYGPPMNFPLAERKVRHARPRIVILGAGFGGLNAALALKRADADITIIDRHNYHLFQPLLYQVATYVNGRATWNPVFLLFSYKFSHALWCTTLLIKNPTFMGQNVL